MLRLLLASDDRDLSFSRLKELVDDDSLLEMSDAAPSDRTSQALVESGIQVALAHLDSVAEVVQQRARLGFYFDAILLLTIRPYRTRGELLFRAAERIRVIPEASCFPNGIRLRALPIILIDIITLLTGQPLPIGDYGAVRSVKWCYIHPPGHTVGEVVSQAVAAWRSELLLELDYVGYGISFSETGQIEVDHVLRRKPQESEFFGEAASPTSLRRSG